MIIFKQFQLNVIHTKTPIIGNSDVCYFTLNCIDREGFCICYRLQFTSMCNAYSILAENKSCFNEDISNANKNNL